MLDLGSRGGASPEPGARGWWTRAVKSRCAGRPIAGRTVTRAVPVLVASALTVVGCSSDDDAGPLETTPPTTPAQTESPDPTPSEPTQEPTPDPDPTEELEAEITEFFEEYIDAINESWTSEEALQRRREMFADSCEECLIGYEFAKRKHHQELRFEGDDVEVLDVSLVSAGDGVVVITTVIDSPPGRLIDNDGALVQEFDEYEAVQSVYQLVKNETGVWIIIKGEVI
ncbi:hypothetical protein G1H11_05345 [Phytoactinopolyspora alkaliphila]|uniref:Uncharacterized protein n=1 Tax=Phytoactinopolyspora alkaliphila TaxID=1783498 RepID=A0A6N9YI54_9ACTN|nr:hypothetical protein [Phytoactinopolyspora alkaliphila]NED94731.1 hypothetical protein [Phytoactinopolyspora alkaliphila]